MPAPQLHLTFGELVQHHTGLPTPLRRACAAEPGYTRLGSIFHDLPYYYAPMLFEAVRYGLGAPALDEPWGFRMHSMHPERLVASFLSALCLEPELTQDERLALAAGLLSHCALDLAMHPLVNYCARRDTELLGGHESTHHRMTEKYHALFFHIDRFGFDPIGTPAFAEKTRVTKRATALRAQVEAPLLRVMTQAFRGAYGGAPAAARWAGWVRNFRQFGLLCSMPIAQKNSLRMRTEEIRKRYYQNEVFDFPLFYAAAERRLAHLGWLGYEFVAKGDTSPEAQQAFCAASGIDDLAEPTPVDIPALPLLAPVRGQRPLIKPAKPVKPVKVKPAKALGGRLRLRLPLRRRPAAVVAPLVGDP